MTKKFEDMNLVEATNVGFFLGALNECFADVIGTTAVQSVTDDAGTHYEYPLPDLEQGAPIGVAEFWPWHGHQFRIRIHKHVTNIGGLETPLCDTLVGAIKKSEEIAVTMLLNQLGKRVKDVKAEHAATIEAEKPGKGNNSNIKFN